MHQLIILYLIHSHSSDVLFDGNIKADVEKIKEHQTLKKVLGKIDYDGYLSIEMKNQNDISKVQKAVLYLKENF